jgi:(1->4)-alpha-D-glucan 1-alpha-D-glucosylmutase
MKVPTATYRIQFRNGMTFDRAARLVPYLKRLGISHLYASPIFTATSGSTHGYDVTDANEIDPSLGGREGFERLVRALKSAGLELIIDIVPNHMAASLENPWWKDVVTHGEKSRYAHYFDIDWRRRLTLPFLGDTFEKVLEQGDIAVKADPATGLPVLACYETLYPLDPDTYMGREADVLRHNDREAIAALHARQNYRLMSWRDAPNELSYRRFFEITGLAGLRVEDADVFDDAHRLILELVHSDMVDGLRVDHVDGLADPKAYLERLRQKAGPDCHITVEKILGEGEQLPKDWPVSGTTGYEFIAALSDVFVDGAGLDTLRDAYQQTAGGPIDMPDELRAAKCLMADRNFAGEASTLLRLAMQIHETEEIGGALSEPAVKSALRELLVGFTVYRTYGTRQGLPPESRQRLEAVSSAIRSRNETIDPQARGLIERLLLGDVAPDQASAASVFRTRFQQLTGPLMAKSVEDTLFFRQHAFLALNEVGAEPLPHRPSVALFHQAMEKRLAIAADALSGTSTHDTKRGEDARARLYTLSEAPEVWAEAVLRWRRMHREQVKQLADGMAPEATVEWMLYQALAGVWPPDLAPDDQSGLKALEDRFIPFVDKALREAKLRTDWARENAEYEHAVLDYARSLFAADNLDFREDFVATLAPFLRAGLVNGLAQTIVKLTAPGVPDIYQGCEGLDFSLVDPDNRREPDFDTLERQLADHRKPLSDTEADWRSGRLKQHVVATLLHLRQEAPSLFRRGGYHPLAANGKRAGHLLAFARMGDDDALIVIVPRLVLAAFGRAQEEDADRGMVERRQGRWAETEIALPSRLAGRRYRDLWSGLRIDAEDTISVAEALRAHPFAILRAE